MNVINLATLAGVAVAGFWDHRIWALALPIEMAVMWIVPDLPPFQKWVEKKHQDDILLAERESFLQQLWGLEPAPPGGIRSWFFEAPPTNPDDRVQDRRSHEFHAYLEMRAIVGRLRELVTVRGVHVTEVEIRRCEEVINGYLRMLIACQPLSRAVNSVDIAALDEEIAEIEEQLAFAEGPLRAALTERRQLRQQQRARAPRLAATLQLFQARAEAIVGQLRDIHGQVLADPGMNVNEMLDAVIDRHEAITDPLSQASTSQLLDEFLRKPSVQERLAPAAAEGTDKKPPPKRPPPQRQRQ